MQRTSFATARQIQEKMRSVRFGIEIELATVYRSEAAVAISEATGKVAKFDGYRSRGVAYRPGSSASVRRTFIRRHPREHFKIGGWVVKSDCSIRTSSKGSTEITSPPMFYDSILVLQDVVRRLRAFGASANPSCGIHIHIDGEEFSEPSLRALVVTFESIQRHVLYSLRVHDNRLRGYSSRINSRVGSAMNGDWSPRRGLSPEEQVQSVWRRFHSGRYQTLNLSAYWYRGTIEFRLFNSTMHAGIVKTNVHLVLALAARSLLATEIEAIEVPRRGRFHWKEMRRIIGELGLSGREFNSTRYHLLKRPYINQGVRLPKPAPCDVEA